MKPNNMFLQLPDSTDCIKPGDVIKLGRFSSDEWTVQFGWYEFGGNRAVCGWYLSKDGGLTVKPIQQIDLYDIYMISH